MLYVRRSKYFDLDNVVKIGIVKDISNLGYRHSSYKTGEFDSGFFSPVYQIFNNSIVTLEKKLHVFLKSK